MKRSILISFSFLLVFGAVQRVQAQMNYTLFGFNGVANTALYHPSTIDSAKFVLGLPGLSRVEFSTVQNFATLGLFSTSNDFQTEFENMVSGLDQESSLRFHDHIDLFLMGLRFNRKTYITFGAYQEAYAILSPPSQLLDVIYNGNVSYINQVIDLSHTNISGLAYGALHAGLAQQFGDRLTVGVRAKMLSGLAAVQTDVRKLDLSIRESNPAPFTWELNSDFDIYSHADTVNYLSNLLNFTNYGFAMDFSVDYRFTRKITASFGMRDMGSINWSTENSNLAKSRVENYEFDGIEIVLGNSTDIEEQINQLIDTLASPFEIVNQKDVAWSSRLPSTRYAQLSYRLTPNHIISGNFFQHDFLGTPLSAYGVSYSGAFGTRLRVKGNVLLMDNGTQNWGAGISIGKALQFYLAMDYVQNLTDVNQFSGVSTAVGMNFTFGKQSKRSYEVTEREYWKAKRVAKREARKSENERPALDEPKVEPAANPKSTNDSKSKSSEDATDDGEQRTIYKSNVEPIPVPPTPEPVSTPTKDQKADRKSNTETESIPSSNSPAETPAAPSSATEPVIDADVPTPAVEAPATPTPATPEVEEVAPATPTPAVEAPATPTPATPEVEEVAPETPTPAVEAPATPTPATPEVEEVAPETPTPAVEERAEPNPVVPADSTAIIIGGVPDDLPVVTDSIGGAPDDLPAAQDSISSSSAVVDSIGMSADSNLFPVDSTSVSTGMESPLPNDSVPAAPLNKNSALNPPVSPDSTSVPADTTGIR